MLCGTLKSGSQARVGRDRDMGKLKFSTHIAGKIDIICVSGQGLSRSRNEGFQTHLYMESEKSLQLRRKDLISLCLGHLAQGKN